MKPKDSVALVTGAGQMPGDTIENRRATAILFAREGARVLLMDSNFASALEAQALIEADLKRAADCRAFAQAAVERYVRIVFFITRWASPREIPAPCTLPCT